jgi:YgiT-type zinc finger domain-containing protein
MSRKKDSCEVCGKPTALLRRLSRSYGKGASLLVVENVPVFVCVACGESYMTAETLHELERIKLHRRSMATSRKVAVASFG